MRNDEPAITRVDRDIVASGCRASICKQLRQGELSHVKVPLYKMHDFINKNNVKIYNQWHAIFNSVSSIENGTVTCDQARRVAISIHRAAMEIGPSLALSRVKVSRACVRGCCVKLPRFCLGCRYMLSSPGGSSHQKIVCSQRRCASRLKHMP